MIIIYNKSSDGSLFNINYNTGQLEEAKDTTIPKAAEFELKPVKGTLSYEQDPDIREVVFFIKDEAYLAVNKNIRAIASQLKYNGVFMGVPTLDITVKSSEPISFESGDYIIWEYDELKYVFDSITSETKQATAGTYGEAFVYELKFVSPIIALRNINFLDIVKNDNNIHYTSLPIFSFYGKAIDLVDRINTNIERIYDNIEVVISNDDPLIGEILSEYKDIEVSNTDCLSALAMFYQLWEVGYILYYDKDLSKYFIQIGAYGGTTSNFKYGQGNGLHLVKRSVDNSGIVTRLRAYGNDENMPNRFYNKLKDGNGDPIIGEMQYVPNLMIPVSKWGITAGKADVLKAYIDSDSADVDINDTSMQEYGVIERSVFFNGSDGLLDIKPTIKGLTAKRVRDAILEYTGDDVYYSPKPLYLDGDRIDKFLSIDSTNDDGVVLSKSYYSEDGVIDAIDETIYSTSKTVKTTLSSTLEMSLSMEGEYKVRFDDSNLKLSSIESVVSDSILKIYLTENSQRKELISTIEGSDIAGGQKVELLGGNFTISDIGNTYGLVFTLDVTLSDIDYGTTADISISLDETNFSFIFVKSVPNNIFTIDIPQIGFDISKYLSESGGEPVLNVVTGECAGRDFIIKKVDYIESGDKWRLSCARQVDESLSQSFPNNHFHIRAGDEFVLSEICMPDIYVLMASFVLYDEACKWLRKNKDGKVALEPTIDNVYMAYNPQLIKEGMLMALTDNDFSIDESVLIHSLTIIEGNSPVREFSVVLKRGTDETLGSYISSIANGETVRIVGGIVNAVTNKNQSSDLVYNTANIDLARRNTIRQDQLEKLIFDQDGYFNNENIRPNSIETLYLSVGAKSTDFRLNGVRVSPNHEGDKNALSLSVGQLIHLRLSPPDNSGIWSINSPYFTDNLTSETSYYIYAKCAKNASNASWVVSDERLLVENGDGYYYFLVGILYSVLEFPAGVFARDYDFTYGMTYINGRVITTGRIRSINGQNYIDLDYNKFRVGDSTSSLDWNVSAPNRLTLKGAMTQSPAGIVFPVRTFRGAFVSGTTYYKGDEVVYDGESWVYINDTASTNSPIAVGYWEKSAAKGLNGAMGLSVSLLADDFVFTYDTDGLNPIPVATTITAMLNSIGGNEYYDFYLNDVRVQNTTSDTYTYYPQADFTDMPDVVKVLVRLGHSGGVVIATDVITLYGLKEAKDGENGENGENGIDGYTVIVTNEVHALPASNDGTISSFTGSGTDIMVFSGTTPLNYGTGANTFEVFATPANVTIGSASTVSSTIRRYADITAMSADKGSITFVIKYRDKDNNEVTINKIQSFAKAKAGSDGLNGADGKSPALVYRGVYNGSTTYYGNENRVDAVKDIYGSYWRAKITAGTFSGKSPSEGAYWTAFGASFESVATGLLLAERAVINNLIVANFEGETIRDKYITGSVETVAYASPSTKRRDEITLTSGEYGSVAYVGCNGISELMEYVDSGLADTASRFVSQNQARYSSFAGISLVSVENKIIFESLYFNTDFTIGASIDAPPYPAFQPQGGVWIRGNDIWVPVDNNDEGVVNINRKGYDGGFAKYRSFYVYDGRGNYLLRLEGNAFGGATNFHTASVIFNGDFLSIAGTQLSLPNIPSSPSGLASGSVYKDINGYLRIV